MVAKNEIVMGINFSNVKEANGEMYFSGDALEEGVWTDARGNTAFYPREVIRLAAKSFEGVKVLCEHRGGTVGQILETEETELGFRVTKGVLRHKGSIESVMSGNKGGLSIRALVRLDPIRRVVAEIFSPEEISLVSNPACRTCMIDDDFSEGETHMSESRVDASLEVPDCARYPDDSEEYDACQEFGAAIEAFKDAEIAFQEAEETWSSIIKDRAQMSGEDDKMVETEVNEEVEIEASAPVTIEDIETAATEVVEVETEEVTETEVAEETEVVETEEVVEETEVEVVASAVTQEEIDSLLGEAKKTLEAMKVEKASLSAEVSVLRAENTELKSAEHSRLMETAMSADPNADTEFIESMSNAELSAYVETVERLKVPSVGAKRRSVKKETVELAAPAVAPVATGRAATENFINFLSTFQ